LSYHLTFCAKITTVKNFTWCHTFLIDHRENLKVHFFLQGDLASPYTIQALFQAHICGSNVPQILCLQHPGIVVNWIDFKPPFQNKSAQQSLLCLLFAAIYLIWERNKPRNLQQKVSVIIYIYMSFSMGMLLLDIWSNFWVTVHTSWVLMSVKQLIHSPIYRLNHFCCKCWLHLLVLFEWFWWCLWPKIALEMSQEFLTVSLDITNKASHRLSLVEQFAKIAVYKCNWVCCIHVPGHDPLTFLSCPLSLLIGWEFYGPNYLRC